MAISKTKEYSEAKACYKEALKLLVKLREVPIVKNNNLWYAKLGNVENEMKKSLGAILVKEEMRGLK